MKLSGTPTGSAFTFRVSDIDVWSSAPAVMLACGAKGLCPAPETSSRVSTWPLGPALTAGDSYPITLSPNIRSVSRRISQARRLTPGSWLAYIVYPCHSRAE